MSFIISEQIALPIFLLRYVSLMAPGAHRGADQSPPPLYPRALAANRRFVVPSTYPLQASGVRLRQRPCKTRPSAPHPCGGLPRPSGTSQRFWATSTGSFSQHGRDIKRQVARTIGRVRRWPPADKKTAAVTRGGGGNRCTGNGQDYSIRFCCAGSLRSCR